MNQAVDQTAGERGQKSRRVELCSGLMIGVGRLIIDPWTSVTAFWKVLEDTDPALTPALAGLSRPQQAQLCA